MLGQAAIVGTVCEKLKGKRRTFVMHHNSIRGAQFRVADPLTPVESGTNFADPKV